MSRLRLATLLSALLALGATALCVGTRRHDEAAAPEVSPAQRADPSRPLVVDVHVHLASNAVGRLLGLMQRYGFDHVVNLSGGHPRRGLSAQLEAARRSGGRVTVFATLAYEQVEAEGYGERMAALLRESQRMGARGLKIAKALGLGLPGPDGKLLGVDDPGLDPVFETAGALGLPVAIHSGDPKAFWDPVDAKNERYAELKAHPGWALAGEKVPSFHEIVDQLERRVARHPKTTFISVHFGNDAEEPERVARMLRKYPNLYIDTAARIPEMGRHPPAAMRAFFVEFQDRILYGSDLGVGPEGTPLFLGSEGDQPPTPREQELFFSATRRYFETADTAFEHPTPIQGNWKISGIDLPRPVLEKIYAKNALRVLGIQPRRIDAP
jgi:predicted TIM-barrel fold metal-dependent hydrolase